MVWSFDCASVFRESKDCRVQLEQLDPGGPRVVVAPRDLVEHLELLDPQ